MKHLIAILFAASVVAETLVWNPSTSTDVVAYRWTWNGTNNVTTFTNAALGTLKEGSTHYWECRAVSSNGLESIPSTLAYTKPVATPPCTYDLSVLSQTFSYAGGHGSVEVNTGSNCTWSVTGVPPWVVGQASGMVGSGKFSFTVQPNNGAQRSAIIMVAGKPFKIVQEKRKGKPI